MNQERQELRETALENIRYYEQAVRGYELEIEHSKNRIKEEKAQLEKLKEETWWGDSVSLSQVKDGDIGVIFSWGAVSEYIGYVVQRCGEDLIRIGYGKGFSWPKMFSGESLLLNEQVFRIQIIKNPSIFSDGKYYKP
jgi:hypothetical protein